MDHQRRQVEQAQELRPVARSHRGNRLAGQADRLVSLDATIDVAAHEVELILSRAARAITVREGKCRTHEPLPAEHAERLALIERLAAGLP